MAQGEIRKRRTSERYAFGSRRYGHIRAYFFFSGLMYGLFVIAGGMLTCPNGSFE